MIGLFTPFRDPVQWGLMAAALPIWWLFQTPHSTTILPDPLTLLVLILFSPLLEEFLFRGHLQPWLTDRLPSKSRQFALANLLTSLAFCLAHIWHHSYTTVILLLPVSFAFGYLRDRQQNWFGAFWLHLWYNLGWVWVG